EILTELLARATVLRSARWDMVTQSVLQISGDWVAAIRDRWPRWFSCEVSVGKGWADLISATTQWISETDPGFGGFEQVKEKYGGLRVYHLGGSEMTDNIIEA